MPLPAVVSPYVAAWLVRRAPEVVRGMRGHALRARAAGNEVAAAQLEQAAAHLVESARQYGEALGRPVSVDGNAEVVSAEIGSASGVQVETPPTLDAAGAGVLLDLSPRRVRQLCREGALSGRQVGRVWVVDRESVESLREARRAG